MRGGGEHPCPERESIPAAGGAAVSHRDVDPGPLRMTSPAVPQQGGPSLCPAATKGACLGSSTIPSGQRCRGFEVPGAPVQTLPLLKEQVLSPGLVLPLQALSLAPGGAAEGWLKHQLAARAMAVACSVPWCPPAAGSAQCLGLRERCHGRCGRPGTLWHSPATLPRAAGLRHTGAAASSPTFFFFSSSFPFLGVGGGRKGGRTNLSVWMLGNKTLHKPLHGAACTSLPWG